MKIGIIGLGDMGKLYATRLSAKGHRVFGCDLPEKKHDLEKELAGTKVHIFEDGHAVSRLSDMIIYSVPSEDIESAVAMYGPSTKRKAIVAGQTSVKSPEIAAFEKYLPGEANIVTCHSMHRPSLRPEGQNMIIINHRSTDLAYEQALEVFKAIGSNIIELPSIKVHDKMTTDTQAVTHLALEGLGASWQGMNKLPWETQSPAHMIDNISTSAALTLFSGKSHVYAGIAMLNPYAMQQIRQYQRSASELLDLMTMGRESRLRKRISEAGEFVFSDEMRAATYMLLGGGHDYNMNVTHFQQINLKNPISPIKPTSHLFILAMVDSWHKLGINPYDNRACTTPQYEIRLGVAEHLFRHHALLEESLQASLNDPEANRNDRYFCASVKSWADLIGKRDFDGFIQKYDGVKDFLGVDPRVQDVA